MNADLVANALARQADLFADDNFAACELQVDNGLLDGVGILNGDVGIAVGQRKNRCCGIFCNQQFVCKLLNQHLIHESCPPVCRLKC